MQPRRRSATATLSANSRSRLRRRSKEPIWVPRLAVEAAQLDQIREHGGLAGIRDEAALDAALNRARQKCSHADGELDLAELAAAYGFGIRANHPFRDDNRRAAFLAVVMFLGLNGHEIVAQEEEVVHVVRGLAAGDISEEALANWIRERTRPDVLR